MLLLSDVMRGITYTQRLYFINAVHLSYTTRGKMLTDDLEKAINSAKKDGRSPMAVVATAGTTVLGAFDPFTEIAAICKRYNLWMHIDVCNYLCEHGLC